MKKNDEKISIIIPVYNGELYLSECIESVLNQTYKNIEVILINDGSQDDSLKICNKYKKIDSRIKVLDIENGGVSNARNIGIENATGTYISFVDSDDLLLPEFIEKLYAELIKKDVDVVRCNYIKKDFTTGFETRGNLYDYREKVIEINTSTSLISNFCTAYNNIPCYVWLLLIKKDKIVQFNKMLSYMEDTEFYLRLLLNINKIYFLDECLYIYRINNQGVSNNPKKVKKNIEAIIESGVKIREDLTNFKIDLNQLNKDLNTYLVITIINKLKMLSNYEQSLEIFLYLKENETLDYVLNNLNKKEIPGKIMFEYLFLKKKKYKRLIRINNIKRRIKRK